GPRREARWTTRGAGRCGVERFERVRAEERRPQPRRGHPLSGRARTGPPRARRRTCRRSWPACRRPCGRGPAARARPRRARSRVPCRRRRAVRFRASCLAQQWLAPAPCCFGSKPLDLWTHKMGTDPIKKWGLSPFMRIAIVTGASSGIGRAAALRLAGEGWRVLGVGRDSAALERVGREAGPGFVPFQADVTEEAAPREIVAAAVSLSAPIGGLVQAAGIIASGAVDATSDEGWDTMFGVNVRAPFRLLREAAPHLVAARGAVVNVSSVTGL